jgi:hypothetical protein
MLIVPTTVRSVEAPSTSDALGSGSIALIGEVRLAFDVAGARQCQRRSLGFRPSDSGSLSTNSRMRPSTAAGYLPGIDVEPQEGEAGDGKGHQRLPALGQE